VEDIIFIPHRLGNDCIYVPTIFRYIQLVAVRYKLADLLVDVSRISYQESRTFSLATSAHFLLAFNFLLIIIMLLGSVPYKRFIEKKTKKERQLAYDRKKESLDLYKSFNTL
jgi:hypothetical protein